LEYKNLAYDPCPNIYKYTRLQYECKGLYLIISLELSHYQASKNDKDRRDKPRGKEGDRDGIRTENSEP
jgi:hypothetical protein